MRLKTEGVLFLCIIVDSAKTCFEKFALKLRRLVQQFTSGKYGETLVYHISQTDRRIKKMFFAWKII